MKVKPDLSFWKLWNISFGFLACKSHMLCKAQISAAFFHIRS